MSFKIETVKWSWAKPVQNKNVYRDDEFVRTKTKEQALEAIGFLLNQPKGLTYTITVSRDGEYFTYFRHSMPCLGGWVKYLDSHGERYFMNPYFPRDIRVAFPEGDIVFIGAHRPNTKDILKNPYWEFCFSQESPWVAAFGHKDTVIFKDKYFVLTDMNTDPTVFYSLMRLAGLAGGGGGLYAAQRAKWNPKAEILFSKTGGGGHNLAGDPRRLAGQKPIKISGGTWAEGFGYTRPYNESIFKTKLPHKLSQFSKLAGYPQAIYTNEYFITQMKKKFKVDMSNMYNFGTQPDQKVHDALVEAWDYFKEESKELSDVA